MTAVPASAGLEDAADPSAELGAEPRTERETLVEPSFDQVAEL